MKSLRTRIEALEVTGLPGLSKLTDAELDEELARVSAYLAEHGATFTAEEQQEIDRLQALLQEQEKSK